MLICLFVDFHAADVATRERFHLSPKRAEAIYQALHTGLFDETVKEVAVVSTCNRIEMYASCPGITNDAIPRIIAMLASRWTPNETDATELLSIAAIRTGIGAARHALRVASGLESQVLGDAQILWQFRRAHANASAAGACGPVLHRLFETALRAGKRVQSRTALCNGGNSVGAQAVALAAQRLAARGSRALSDAAIAIVGCGKTGERTARQFARLGARNVVLLNRSAGRAEELGEELGFRTAPMDALYAVLAVADIALVATAAAEPIVCAHELQRARASALSPTAPLLLIDLSVPRNIEAAVATLAGVSLIDIDAIQPMLSAAEQVQRAAIPAAENLVEAELLEFSEWLATECARDAIRPLRESMAEACRRELEYAMTADDAERVAKRIVAKVMAAPMHAFRETLARGEPVADLTRSMHILFSRLPSRASVE